MDKLFKEIKEIKFKKNKLWFAYNSFLGEIITALLTQKKKPEESFEVDSGKMLKFGNKFFWKSRNFRKKTRTNSGRFPKHSSTTISGGNLREIIKKM